MEEETSIGEAKMWREYMADRVNMTGKSAEKGSHFRQ